MIRNAPDALVDNTTAIKKGQSALISKERYHCVSADIVKWSTNSEMRSILC